MNYDYQHWGYCGQCGFRCGLYLYKLLLLVGVVLVVPAAVFALAVTIVCLPGLLISAPVMYCCRCDDMDDDEKCFIMVFVSVELTAFSTHIQRLVPCFW